MTPTRKRMLARRATRRMNATATAYTAGKASLSELLKSLDTLTDALQDASSLPHDFGKVSALLNRPRRRRRP